MRWLFPQTPVCWSIVENQLPLFLCMHKMPSSVRGKVLGTRIAVRFLEISSAILNDVIRPPNPQKFLPSQRNFGGIISNFVASTVLIEVLAPPWWRHQMETFSALLSLCEGNPPVDSSHKSQWRGALTFYLTCAWTNGWVNNRDSGDLRRHRHHYDVTVMFKC